MKVGTKSVLFGAHCWFIHPLFVALAWWNLYGFPWDPRLWIAFFIHDLGYWGKPNMDGPEGESHVEFGAKIMHRLFDKRYCAHGYQDCGKCGPWEGPTYQETTWQDFCLYHSRFYSRRDGKHFSELCPADKLAVALEPWWLYLPRVIASGEIHEYVAIREKEGSKYTGEPKIATEGDLKGLSPRRRWHLRMAKYCRAWAYEHADQKADSWTPGRANH